MIGTTMDQIASRSAVRAAGRMVNIYSC